MGKNRLDSENLADNLDETEQTNETSVTIGKKMVMRRRKLPKLIMNLSYTFYPIVKRVAKELNFRVRQDDIQLVNHGASAANNHDYYNKPIG